MKKELPLIGLVCGHQEKDPERYFVNNAYIQAVVDSGGMPLLIPYQPKESLRRLIGFLDGLLVPGGVDVDPKRYGQNPTLHCGRVDPLRDELDLLAVGFALERDLPILAVCRGLQILNVALGGSLVQDIPSQVSAPIKHMQEAAGWYATHDLILQGASLLKEILGTDPAAVNSFHHQSIAAVGSGLRVAASAPDGVIEAVEGTSNRFVLGVQWHPELMVGHYPAAARIFKRFVESASAN